jgi:hypothetical protein
MERSDWKITVYDADDRIIDSWTLESRTEDEATREAASDVQKNNKAHDWAMAKIEVR